MVSVVRFIPVLLLASLPLAAISVQRGSFGTDVDEDRCSPRKPSASFRDTDRTIFVALTAASRGQGEDLRVEWVSPSGTVEQQVPYADVPSSQSLCFISQLPISGFPAAGHAGVWTVRAVSGGNAIWFKTFTLEATGGAEALRITSVARTAAGDLTVDGAGFQAGSIVHLAEYKADSGWKYTQSLLPAGGSPNRLSAHAGPLAPGEYFVIVRNSDGATSKPARFVISTAATYHLPFAGGERWVITQGPYGSFSHWHNSLHAYDIAPRSGGWVTAMQDGVAYTHDLKMRQDHHRRTFGNYITVQHDNGEFSHYAHLATGTFLVKNGDRVQGGQPLARVGNSGYTLGEGGGVHLHVHVTKTIPASAPSIPFQFDELSAMAVTKLRGLEVSSNAAPPAAEILRRASLPREESAPGKVITGSVQVASTWTESMVVPPGAKAVAVMLTWTGADRDLDLHLVSPSGHHHGWYGDASNYSGQKSNPEQFQIANPEPGTWRVMVQGMGGGSEAIPFQVKIGITGEPPVPVRARSRRRVPSQAD